MKSKNIIAIEFNGTDDFSNFISYFNRQLLKQLKYCGYLTEEQYMRLMHSEGQ